MKPTMEILERTKENSQKNKDEVFTRLYRYMLRPDLYYIAYKKLYSNNGAATKGINDDTADGFSEKKVADIIKSLTDESYSPSPSRRTYIAKQNGKERPLGIPTFTDKLIQEVLRMILEAVYEPVFSDFSHGFRPKRSCHTALKSVVFRLNGARWFIEGDIRGCFDNINHDVLVGFINNKIKDARLTKLIYKFLKAGYLADFQYNNTYSGTPQGGIISPLLANIYLHELDNYMEKLIAEFQSPAEKQFTPEYAKATSALTSAKKKLNKAIEKGDDERRNALRKEVNALRSVKLKTPAKSQTDKKISYIRYADDFIVGVNGNKEDCLEIKRKLSEFIKDTLKMELSEEKTLITHSNQYARFLGYDVRVRRSGIVKPNGRGALQRTMSNHVELSIPLQDKINKFLFDNKIVQQKDGKFEPVKRDGLLRLTDLEIVSSYNAELRGICNYYNLAGNFYMLDYFSYLMEYSCLKTLAGKHKSTISKIKAKYRDKKGGWCIPYETKKGKKQLYLAKYSDCTETNPKDTISNMTLIHKNTRSTFESRLKAKVCELCGTTESDNYEIHHINKLKNLKGKEPWKIMMISKRRKTMVLCWNCHHNVVHK